MASKIIEEVENVWRSLINIQQKASDRVSKILGLLLQPKVKRTAKIICPFRVDSKQMPKVRTNMHDLESACNVCFQKPRSATRQANEGDGMVNCGISHGEIGAGY